MCARDRRPIPRTIVNAPELNMGLEFVYSSFWELSSCRPIGWGFGAIPWSVIFDYCQGHELDDEDTEEFVYLIRAMDKAFLEHHSPEAPKDNPRPQSSAKK